MGVDFGGRADRTDVSDAAARYANKRAEMWGFMKEWCKSGCLPDDRELSADLRRVDYGYDACDAILLERKDDMRRRGPRLPRRRRRAGAHVRLSGGAGATGPKSAASTKPSRG